MISKTIINATLLAFISSPLCFAIAEENTEEPAPKISSVQYIHSELKPHTKYLSLFGKTHTNNISNIGSPVDGRVARIQASEGDFVNTGDTLLQLDNTSELAQLKALEAQSKELSRRKKAIEKLLQSNTASELELEQIKSSIASNKASLESIKTLLRDMEITAPHDGYVNSIPTTENSLISKNQTLIEITGTPNEVTSEVPQNYASSLAVGEKVMFTISDNRYIGEISFVGKMVDENTNTIDFKAKFPSPFIASNLSGTLYAPVGTSEAHEIPLSALVFSDKEIGAYYLDGENAKYASVEIKDILKNFAYVNGLPKNAKVITVGQYYLTDGEKVKAVESK